ncbi:UNVERIFIED_CONTAM: hypothetical protein Sradi_7189900, partial [Sesamum radiatum]
SHVALRSGVGGVVSQDRKKFLSLVSAADPTLKYALCLDVKTEGFDMMSGAQNVILMYRICYKAMNTVVPDMKKISNQDPNTTTLFITDIAKSNTVVPKTISWDQVKLPEKWILEDGTRPVKQENRKLNEIIEYQDGTVEIKFSKERIVRLITDPKEEIIPKRNSTSSIPLSRIDTEQVILKNTLDGVSQPEYKVDIPSSSGTRVKSPTPSDMGYEDDRSVFGINTITLDNDLEFPFDENLKELFYSPENEVQRKWFSLMSKEKQQKWFKTYKKFIKKMNEGYDFFKMIKLRATLLSRVVVSQDRKKFLSLVSAADPTLKYALCLDVKTEGFDMMSGAQNVILMYRICYKAMNTVVPDMKKISNQDPNTTTLFITDIAKSNTVVPKTISWDQVKLPEKWILEDGTRPVKQENRKLNEIIEYQDGTVEIKFSKERIVRLITDPKEEIIPKRNSTSSIPLSRIDTEQSHVALQSGVVSQDRKKFLSLVSAA